MLKKLKKIFKEKKFDYTKKFKNYESIDNYLKTNKLYLDKDNKYHDSRFTKKFFGPNEVESIERFLPASLIVALSKNKNINILDIGGGNNPIYSYIKKSTDISVNCYVLETSKFSKIIKKKIPSNLKSKVKYISNLSDVKKKLDIVCFISSIQYLRDYEKIVEKLTRQKPNFFIITRTFFQDKKENYYSIENCVPGSIHPYIFFSLDKLKKLFKKNGYTLIFQNKYNENTFSHDSENSKLFFHKDLVFKRL